MDIIVMKFGGSSLATIEKIQSVAKSVKAQVLKGNKVIMAVSAMAGETDKLIKLTYGVSKPTTPESRCEFDSIISTGEQISAGLIALALQNIGVKSRSWLSWQSGMNTSSLGGSIKSVSKIKQITDSFAEFDVAVVAGFQGINNQNRITTLGRSGTDTSAVALAVACNAVACYIYKDVDGIYSADPRICPDAKKLDHIGYKEMVEMSAGGTKALHTRSVDLAMKNDMSINICFIDECGKPEIDENKSTDANRPVGTLVSKHNHLANASNTNNASKSLTGVAYRKNVSVVRMQNIPKETKTYSMIFKLFDLLNIHPDLVSISDYENYENYENHAYNESHGNHQSHEYNESHQSAMCSVSFIVPDEEVFEAQRAADVIKEEIDGSDCFVTQGFCAVSVVGEAMIDMDGVVAVVVDSLAEKNIDVHMIGTSKIRITCVIDESRLADAINILHKNCIA